MADQPTPTLDQRVAAHHDYLSKLSHRVDALAAAQRVQKATSRMDSADSRKDDDTSKALLDALAAIHKRLDDMERREDDRRRDRSHDDAAPEECAEEPGEVEPEPLSADDDRLSRHEDDRRRDSRADRYRDTRADAAAMGTFQHEAFRIANIFGRSLERPRIGETYPTYRARTLTALRRYLPEDHALKNADFRLVADEHSAEDLKNRMLHDLDKHGMSPSHGDGTGLLREVKTQDRTGRWISTFHGPVDAANGMFKPFELPPMRFKGFDPETLARGKRGR